MPIIPEAVLKHRQPIEGLKLLGRGKVRNTYEIPGHPSILMSEASNGISALDVVLPALIPDKGAVLTAMTDHWERNVFAGLFSTDRLATGAEIDKFLLKHLRGDVGLQERCRIVEKLDMIPCEYVVRGFLTGSGWKSYEKGGTVCGSRLPPGLFDGSELPSTKFTPTTKAEKGHDEAIDVDEAIKLFGAKPAMQAIEMYEVARHYARKRGIIIADTKFEMGYNAAGVLVLGDEILTPDSSRFWPLAGWLKALAAGKTPPSFDKDPVRAFLRKFCKDHGIDKMDPENPDHLKVIHGMIFPEDIINSTRRLYRYAFWSMTGMLLETYQREKMGIKIETPKRKVLVLIGSENDKDQTSAGFGYLMGKAQVEARVLSCDRNPEELTELSHDHFLDFDVIVAGAGKSARLPGAVKSALCARKRPGIPVIGVGFRGSSDRANMAAQLAIEEIPDQPVELDPNGHAYFGVEGFLNACRAAVEHEFPVRDIVVKETKLIDRF